MGYLVGLFMMFDIYGMANNIHVDSGFGLQVMVVESLGVSGTCIFKLHCKT